MAEIYNGRYALADPSSGLTAFSMEGGEINMFGRCTLIRTTQRDSFPIINDAPTELEVEKESNLANIILNGTIGILTGIVLGACAVALIAAAGVATGGMALPCLIAAVPFMVASTAAICTTVGTVENDIRTGYKRKPIEFFNTLMDNTMAAYTAGATIAEVLAVAPSAASYLGTCAVMKYGASFFTKTVVPAIIKTGIGTLTTAKCAFSISDMDANTTHYNWLLDKVFDNDNELYEDCESLVDIMCEGIIAYGGLLPVINPFSDGMEGVHGKNNQKNTKDNAGIDDTGDTSKKGKQSISDADMPDDTQIQKYSHTVNPDGADGEKSGNGKAAVSLEKDAGSTIGTGQSGKGDSSYNNYNTEQWGKNKISEQPEDKDNTTEEEWYEEGVVLECYINRYRDENKEKKYRGFNAGRHIERGDISIDDPIVDEMLKKITEERKKIEEELLLKASIDIIERIKKGFLEGNVAVAKVDMKGPDSELNDIIMAYSGCNNIQAYNGFRYKNEKYACERGGKDKIFDTLVIDNKGSEYGQGIYDRSVDSEVKILEEIAHQLNMEKGQVDKTMDGTIYLATDRAPCRSCKEAIDQFQDMFPNVEVVVIYKYIPDRRYK